MYTPIRRYLRGNRLVAVQDVQAGTTRTYHFDHQGTVQCLTDETGSVTDRFASDAWGVPVKRTGTSINRHWYIGRSGYYSRTGNAQPAYQKARFYDAARARWLSRDPTARASQQHGRYAYVGNDPVAYVDPNGRERQLAVAPAVAFLQRGRRPTNAACDRSRDANTGCYTLLDCCGNNAMSPTTVTALAEWAIQDYSSCIWLPAPLLAAQQYPKQRLLWVIAQVLACTVPQESSWDPHCYAIGVDNDALGLTQLGADEFARCGPGGRICDPWDNIRARAAKLMARCDSFEGDLAGAFDASMGAYGGRPPQFNQCLQAKGLSFSQVHRLLGQVHALLQLQYALGLLLKARPA